MSPTPPAAEPDAIKTSSLPISSLTPSAAPHSETAPESGSATEPTAILWQRLRKLTRKLSADATIVDQTDAFSGLVGSGELRNSAVHRWFAYKEGFSPSLLPAVLDHLELEGPLNVSDCFGGVATTVLSGMADERVRAVRSVEYSPFAHFVGATKALWPELDPDSLTDLLPSALAFPTKGAVAVPALSTFSNSDIFPPRRLRSILRARDHLRQLPNAMEAERDFLLLGLAAVLEDMSGAMRDGRALRIKRNRTRRASSLAATTPFVSARGEVQRALAGQWTAMLTDLTDLTEHRVAALDTDVAHLSGDARDLAAITFPDGSSAFPDEWADVSLFSPPYLNFYDYTELYKLELWMLEFVVDQDGFRNTRLGTLRSHPSLRFPDRNYFRGLEDESIQLVTSLAAWMTEHAARPEVGPIISQYFEDMFQVLREQFRLLRPGGTLVCVVANSTFSRRNTGSDGVKTEVWSLPLLTDVILGRLAELVGFQSVKLLKARDLRPKNIRNGTARESLVTMEKPQV
jgi:hypothetical protein